MLNFADPLKNNKSLKLKILKKISKVISEGRYILGKNVKTFEINLAHYLKVKYVIAMNSGTDALIAALMCIDTKPNDEIIVPSHTATATISSIKLLKAKPIFIDINLSSYTIDVRKISKLITSKTKAIIGVHIYGHPCNNFEIIKICNKYNIFFIEDCAQAIGSEFNGKKLGTFGDFGCFSFFPTKNLSAIGDAGAIVTNNYNHYLKLIKIRQYGWNEKRVSVIDGINSRCDEIQAAILNVKIKFLDIYIRKRREVAKFYNKYLKKFPLILPVENDECKHSYHLYVIRIKKSIRSAFIKFLKKEKIFLGIHYDPPTHKMNNFITHKNNLLNTEKICKEIVSLPMYPELSKKNLFKVYNAINSFFLNIDKIKKMNILITGGAGHIGSFLFRELLKLKKIKKIYIIDSFVNNNFYSVFHIKSKKLFKINEDILNINLKNISNVQIVIHLAATTNAEKSFDNKKLIYKNLLLTKKIVKYCNFNKSTLIFPSTTSVYGSSATIVDESDNKYLNPQSPYAQVKILEENYIKNNCKNFKYLIFRMGTIYGISPGIRFHTAINKFCLQLAFNKNITIWRKNYNFVRPYLCLEDFSQIISKIINKNFIVYNEIYNLVSNNIKLKDIINELKGIKKNLLINFVNTKLINQHSYFVSNKKIQKYGFKFTGNLKKHIARTVQLFL